MSACTDVSCVLNQSTGLPRCSLVQSPIPGLSIPSSHLQEQAVPFFPLFEFKPGTVTKTFVAASAGSVTVNGSVTKTSATPSQVVVAIQGVNALYQKRVFASNETGTVPFNVTIPNLPAGAQLFFTVYSDSDAASAISWAPTIAGVPQQVTFRSRAPGTIPDPSGIGVVELLAGGYHGWSYGLWNAAVPFDENQIAIGTAPSSNFFPLFFQPPPVVASADGQTLALDFDICNPLTSVECAAKTLGVLTAGPALIPIVTDPGVIVTVLVVGPGAYALTQLGGCGGPFSWLSCKSLPALRLTSSTNVDTSVDLGLVNAGVNLGSAASRIDLIDMNGDRYPDAVAKDGTLFNNGAAFETSMTTGMALPLGDLRNIQHYNYHVGAGASGTQNFTDAQGRSTGYNVSGGLGGGFTYGQSVTSTDLVDINGDGLPDHVQANPTTGRVTVRLNLGHRFGKQILWSGQQWSKQPGNLPALLSALGIDPFDGDTLRIEDTSANNVHVSAGGGVPVATEVGVDVNGDYALTHTMLRTVVDLVDINGDGLPDQLMKLQGADDLRVKLNLGTGFDTEKRIPLTNWSVVGAPDGLSVGLFGQLKNLGLGSTNDALSYSLIYGTGFTGGVTVIAPCAGFVPCSYNGSVTNTSSSLNETMAFEDVDGDGTVDQVLKVEGNSQVFARLNVTGKTNLLRRVMRPLGGSFDLDYQRTGNLLGNVLGTRIEMPGNQWALAEVSLNDGRGNTYIDTFDYGLVSGRADLSSGFYDRVERESYGYARVATIHGLPNGTGGFAGGDGSIVERFYQNRDFYRKGLLRAEFEEDHAGKIFRGTVAVHKDPATAAPPARRGIFFPAETDRYTVFYEGFSGNAFFEMLSAGQNAGKSRHEQRFFNANGDLIDLFDFGDQPIIGDDIHYTIVSTNEPGTHITRATSVEAIANATAETLRRRTAVYAPSLGTLTTLTNLLSGGKVPGSGTPGTTYNQASANYGFTYDAFGNLRTSTDPTGYKLQYTYDTTAQTYPTRVDDLSFGFASTATYDLRFGAVQLSTDINGQRESFALDVFGRLCTVRGPDDQTASEPTIAMNYGTNPTSCPSSLPVGAAFPAYAVTRHKDVQHPGDPIDTATFIDGIGRVIHTRKDAQFDLQADGRVVFTGMTISGAVLFDSRGRVSAQGQPEFGNGVSPTQFFVGGIQNPTLYGYDELGRPTSVNVSDGSPAGIQTTTAYSIVTPQSANNLGDGRAWLLTSVTDPRGNLRHAYADTRGNVIAVRELNQVGTSTTVTPLTTRYVRDALDQLVTVTDAKGNITGAAYDTFGQMVTLSSPDAGQTEFRFDLNGNLKEKQTAVLRAASQTIKYVYDFNRLKQIDYPTSADAFYTYGGPTVSVRRVA